MKANQTKLLSLALLVALTACDSAEDTAPANADGAEALFRPTVGIIPIPNNLFFQGTTDLTLNIPSSNPAAIAANSLDGWSTVSPSSFQVNRNIDTTSLVAGSAVRVFNICMNGATTQPTGTPGPDAELIPGVHYSVSTSAVHNGATVFVKPLKPLRPAVELTAADDPRTCAAQGARVPAEAGGPQAWGNGYLVVVTNNLQSVDGERFAASKFYDLAKDPETPLFDSALLAGPTQGATLAAVANGLSPTDVQTLEGVRQLTSLAHEPLAAGITAQANALGSPLPVLAKENIILSYSFSTQSIGASLATIVASAQPQPLGAVFTGLTTQDINPALPGAASVYAGSLRVPSYLARPPLVGVAAADQPADVGNPLDDHWCAASADGSCGNLTRFNPVPIKRYDQTVPMLISVPTAAAVAGAKLPVVVFQHGITQNRSNLLSIADALAAAGIIGVAIDMPLHGITPTDAAAALRNSALLERTFDLDVNQDGAVDGSGAYFLNLADLQVGRDNIRQAVSDLVHLNRSLANLTLPTPDGSGAITIDTDRVGFVGHSLGGIVGGVLIGADGQNWDSATFAMAGGGIAKLLDGSGSFGPTVTSSLAAAGVQEGTPNYETFLDFAQQVIDSADPLNYALVARSKTPIHLMEVLGDTVVPNSVPGPNTDIVFESGPLGGTDPWRRELNLADVTTTTPGSGAVCFSEGDHGSILSPAASLAATVEMQSQTVAFASTNGAAIVVGENAPVTQCP